MPGRAGTICGHLCVKTTFASLHWMWRDLESTLLLFIKKLVYAFLHSWSHGVVPIETYSKSKGGSVGEFSFFQRSTVIGRYWSLPETDGCRLHKNAFQILTIPVCVFNKVLSNQSQSCESWSMTSSSGTYGGTQTSWKKAPLHEESQSALNAMW